MLKCWSWTLQPFLLPLVELLPEVRSAPHFCCYGEPLLWLQSAYSLQNVLKLWVVQGYRRVWIDCLYFCSENEQAEKLNLEQIVEDFVVHKTHRMTFWQMSTTCACALSFFFFNICVCWLQLLRRALFTHLWVVCFSNEVEKKWHAIWFMSLIFPSVNIAT